MLTWLFPVWCCVFTTIMCQLGLAANGRPELGRLIDAHPQACFVIVSAAGVPISLALIWLTSQFKRWRAGC